MACTEKHRVNELEAASVLDSLQETMKMKASKPDVVNAACNVVEALNALEASEKANDGTTQRYRDHLGSCIYRLKFLIERDSPAVIRRLRQQSNHTAQAA